MHATLKFGDSELMVCDNPQGDGAGFKGFSVSIAAENMAHAEKCFNALADGGEIEMPLAKTFWADAFGMVKDKFGLSWMVNLEGEQAS